MHNYIGLPNNALLVFLSQSSFFSQIKLIIKYSLSLNILQVKKMSEVSYLNICSNLEFPMELGCMENYDHFVSLEFLKIQFCKQKKSKFQLKKQFMPIKFSQYTGKKLLDFMLSPCKSSFDMVKILNIC